MNNNLFSVMQSPRGTLSVISENSIEFWEMSQQGYEVVHTGGKSSCNDYVDIYMEEHYLTAE